MKTARLIFLFCFLLFTSTGISAKNPKQIYGDSKSEYWQFWFLYESEKRAGQTETIIRPFFSSYYERQSDHKYQTVLYPLFYREKTNHWEKWSFLFIFSKDTAIHPDTGEDTDFILSPFLQWGKGETDRERYLAFFPFFGSIRSKITWSEINFFLFPLYANWQYKEFKAHAIIWPLILFGSSETRHEYRFLPFFSIKEHIGKYRHFSVLWPFIQWGNDFMDKKEPTSYAFFWPLFNFKKSEYGNMRSYSFLWFPILGSAFSYGYDKRTGEVDFQLFYLFQYGYSNDKDYRKHVFFPFYGYSRYAGKEATFITPFYINLRTDTHLVKTSYHFILPFIWSMSQYYKKEERTDEYFKIWPVFRYHKDTEGNMGWSMFSFFPLRSDTIEKNWEPIWSIIEYKRFINGERRFSLFMRLYTQRWTDTEFHIYIPFLLDLSFEEHRTKIKILYGLFGYEREYDKRTLQLLWFIKISSGEKPKEELIQ